MDATQIAIAERVAEEQRHHKKAQFLWVWAALLVMTGIEVYLTYQNMAPAKMLTILMGLSLIKAALIIGFFMHLRYEISRMKWITMCSVVACLILMTIFFFPDAHRIIDRKSTRLNSSHGYISYAVFCLKKKKKYPLCGGTSTELR